MEIARAVKDPGVQEAAIEKLSDEKVRNKLRQELEEKAQVPCKEGVLTVHADGSVEVSEQLVDKILTAFGNERVIEALGKLRSSEKAIQSLGIIAERGGDEAERAIEFLKKSLLNSHSKIRACALKQLGELKKLDLADIFISAIEQDTDLKAKQQAYCALSALGRSEDIPLFEKAKTHSDPLVRKIAESFKPE
ncbi:MAG: hypothetical protein A2161_06450 [Candidatus Schekmanbacteria bacterium RBG_13_48_7]|uniref:HEAT repeat domain-containing protein n=1 Tax=Candidatus Schekmanbacteria bacterium RBG_13_48_7 TaxID=1817878 RepID=A0A1F7RSX6_9BACT|nr:MAG: hypothetical protein A2161_06450 [Candidatus Schekmanbacteria bacterium RBG_13_48_7]